MGKVINTKWFIDKNRQLIAEIYESRLGKPASELQGNDLYQPEVMKALTELKLYRLPYYFDVPTLIKSRLQSNGSLCYDLENPSRALILERELIYFSAPMFFIKRQNKPCIKCNTRRASNKDGICYLCMSKDADEARELSKVYNNIVRKADPMPEPWISPKTILLAATIGCTHCGVKADSDTVWLGKLEGWVDGLCEECSIRYPLGKSTWSVKTQNSPLHSFKVCQKCGRDTFDYAIWGLCEACYQDWQDDFIDPKQLYAFTEIFGPLAALLLRSSADWIKYLREALDHRIKLKDAKITGEFELVPFKARLPKKVLTFNVKDYL